MVLVGQQGSGDQNRTLATILCSNEGRAHGDLGLAKAHIAADETVHDFGGTHVGFHGFNRRGLIRRFLKGEAFAEPLPLGLIQLVRMPHPGLASGVNIEELCRHIGGAFPGSAARLFPLLAAQPVERCGIWVTCRVAANQVERADRHVEFVALGVLE